jgi:hypothetical protein
MAKKIKHLQDRIVECTLEARSNPKLWHVVDALKYTLAAIVKAQRMCK